MSEHRPGPERRSESCGCTFVLVKGKWWQVIWCPEHPSGGFAWEGRPV